jgi:hypothetical protein
MVVVEAQTLGGGRLEVSRRILEAGADAVYDGQPTRELALVTLRISRPDPADQLIASLTDPGRLDWMRRNFTEPAYVSELRGARSCARRLRDDAHSLDFGQKTNGNLVELPRVRHEVAGAVGLPVGALVQAKSAHVYEPEVEAVRRIIPSGGSHGRHLSSVAET